MKWTLPTPRPFGWTMKTLESARTRFTVLPMGSYEACIEHDLIRGCTVEMIEWWFKNIGGTMEYKGKQYNRYLVWHPADHIHWELVKPGPNGKAEKGAKFKIVEAFNGNMDWLIDTVEEVTKLDKTGIRLRRRFVGVEVYNLEHWFTPHPNGTHYRSRLQVGSETMLGKYLLNPFIQTRIVTETMTKQWLKHNIEEVGNFEFFLPQLYYSQANKSPKLHATERNQS